MSKYIYTATCPDGTIVTRKTDRIYTHAVVGYWRDEEIPTYGMFEFCGRLDLAQKSYKKWTAQGAKVVVVPVDNPRPEPTDTLAEVDMGGDFEGFVEAVNGPQAEPMRIKQLRDRIASQERELIDLRFELSQLLGGK